VPGVLIAVLVGLGVCQVAFFVTTIFLHRTLAHRSITMCRPLHFVCRLLVWVTTGIQPRQWAAVHRRHHAFTDVEGDPHSPILEGFATVEFGNAWLYRKAANDERTLARYARDIPKDIWDRLFFQHGLLGLGVGYAAVALLIGWPLALLAWAVHIVTYLLFNGAINAVGHSFGRRRFDGYATNNQWLAWLVAGEGLHSNHHAAPTSARLSMRSREIDPAWPVIRLARRLGLLTVRHDRPVLAGRSRLAEPEAV
jgi:stearoyl-CoA desaturase (Delta-9 desaturase)